MDLDLTEEQRMLTETVRSFVDKEMLPYELEIEQKERCHPSLGNALLKKP